MNAAAATLFLCQFGRPQPDDEKTHGRGGETSSNKAKLRCGFDRRGSHSQIAEYAAQNYRQDGQNVGSGSKRQKSNLKTVEKSSKTTF
jgi:hypothetical protein